MCSISDKKRHNQAKLISYILTSKSKAPKVPAENECQFLDGDKMILLYAKLVRSLRKPMENYTVIFLPRVSLQSWCGPTSHYLVGSFDKSYELGRTMRILSYVWFICHSRQNEIKKALLQVAMFLGVSISPTNWEELREYWIMFESYVIVDWVDFARFVRCHWELSKSVYVI